MAAMKLSDIKDPNKRKRFDEAISAQDSRNRTRAILQEHEDDCPGKTDNRPSEEKVDEAGVGNFGITVEFLVSDERDRDGDGMLATVLDSYLDAIGRLLEMDRNTLRKLAKNRQGKRRG